MLTVAAFYHFARFDDPAALRGPLLDRCRAADVTGSILLAREGINGTIAGTRSGILEVMDHVRSLPGCAGIGWTGSAVESMPFGRMKVRLKREIVTMGQPDADPTTTVGTYVDPADWNALVSAPDVAVIDTRNAYEVAIGSFAGAVDPGTASFREFPAWWEKNAARFEGKRIAMFCTGGIRCEKATSYLKARGIDEVFHLRGGILNYLESVSPAESIWNGECFVFDQRVSVCHGLSPGTHAMCHACRRPVSAADTARDEYEPGVRCHRCATEYSDADRARFRERQRQVSLAAARGRRHLA